MPITVLSPHSIAAPGTPEADAARDRFIAGILTILGDARYLWVPAVGDTTTSTDQSRHAATITYDASIAGKLSQLGYGVALTFDGTATEADTPDNDRYSFGDGANDEPFSVLALVNPTDATSSTIVSKYDSAVSQEEWAFRLDGSDQPSFTMYDDGAAARIGRLDGTALTQGTWACLAGTYDGTGANPGVVVYLNGAVVSDTDDSTGTYVAMENGAETLALGHEQATGSDANFFDGLMALVAITAKALTVHEVNALLSQINWFFDLSL